MSIAGEKSYHDNLEMHMLLFGYNDGRKYEQVMVTSNSAKWTLRHPNQKLKLETNPEFKIGKVLKIKTM